MDEMTTLLFQRVAVFRSQIEREKMIPSIETVESLITGLEQAVERARDEGEMLAKEKGVLARQNQELAQKNELLMRQNGALERENQNLERECKTLERHNTNLLRQNTQLERHNAALEEGRLTQKAEKQRYRDLFEFAMDPSLITDINGILVDANHAAAEMLNILPGELIGKSLISFVAAPHHPLFMMLLKHMRRMKDIEMRIQPHGADGENAGMDISLDLAALYDQTGKPVLLHWQLRDITERRQAMAALNASERRFRAVFNEARIGIMLLNLDGKIMRANRAVQDILGYGEQELHSRALSELVCPDDPPVSNALPMLKENHNRHFFLENRLRRRDGNYIWVSLTVSALCDEQGQPQYAMAMIENISAEKEAAAELAEMRRRLLENGETERLQLAQVLHDGPTQDLYAAAFRLANFYDLQSSVEQQNNMKELETMLKQVANTLRDTVEDLRPPTIANLGLERAIRSHAERVQEQHPELEVKLHLTRDGQALSPHTRLAFFRIYQQCMMNILHHAQATQAIIALHVNEEETSLDIWDNGKGFVLPSKWVDLVRQGHYGLAGIAERVEVLGGSFRVETRPGAGTLVHVVAPREKNRILGN
jgi:PAS domain S-box-containing protein